MAKGRGRPVGLVETLRRAILESGLSYAELGRRARVSHAQVSRFMAGERDLTLEVAERLCAVLGLELRQRTDPKQGEAVEGAPAPAHGRGESGRAAKGDQGG